MNWLNVWVSTHPITIITIAAILLLAAILLVVGPLRKSSRNTFWAGSNIRPRRTAANPPRAIWDEPDLPLFIRPHLDHTTEHPTVNASGRKNPPGEKNG